MSDIDFDELDRAVSSLVGGAGSSSNEQTTPSNEEDNQSNSPHQTIVPQRRRTGRFMDVVHPSSVMTQAKDKPVITVPTRKAVSPINNDVVPDSIKDIAPPKDTEQGNEDGDNEWIKSLKTKETSPLNEAQTQDQVVLHPDQIAPTPTPIITPFLSDTKVEKRPLGGFSETVKSNEELYDNSSPSKKDSEKKDEITVSEVSAQGSPAPQPDLPPELDSNLIAIESDEAPQSVLNVESEISEDTDEQEGLSLEVSQEDKHNKNSISDTQETSPAIVALSSESSDALSEKNEKKDTNVADHNELDPSKTINYSETIGQLLDKETSTSHAGKKPSDTHEQVKVSGLLASNSVVSIPQQYKRSSAASEQPAHPLFNADHYEHSPSAQAKHHSKAAKWFQWTIIFIGLVLLGGVFGTVAFLFLSGS